jgi:hypothetical protein
MGYEMHALRRNKTKERKEEMDIKLLHVYLMKIGLVH